MFFSLAQHLVILRASDFSSHIINRIFIIKGISLRYRFIKVDEGLLRPMQ